MSLTHVFSPRSIAIVGASSTPGSVGNDLVKNISQGFAGTIYPVNLKGGELYGHPVFTSVKAINKAVDLAVIAVPAAIVPQVLTEVGQAKIKAAMVISAGFKEAGNDAGEKELIAIADKYKITLIGPNCLGMINPHIKLNASFAPTTPPAGSIAFLSQSGALGTAILDYAQTHALGFSVFLSLGNKAQVDEAALLHFLAEDSKTKVILMYIEQMTELVPVLRAALAIRRTRNPKPIIVLKSGQTDQGMKAASSHTGALAGNDAYYDAFFREAGIIRAQSVEELFVYAECFASNPLLTKDRIAVVTNAGGLGVLVTDSLVQEQLTLASLSSETQSQLQAFLPAAASVHNPIDILGDAPADRYRQTLAVVSKDNNVDAIVVLLTPQSMTEVEATARAIVELKKQTKKPLLVTFLGGNKVSKGIGILEQNNITEVSFPEWAARGLGVLHQFTRWHDYKDKPTSYRDFDQQAITRLLKKAHQQPGGWLETQDVLKVLEACQIPVVSRITITSSEEAEAAVTAVGGRAVYKIISPDILHKSDSGGVMLDVTPETAQTAFESMLTQVRKAQPTATITGVLVMEQVTLPNQEMLVGALTDPQLGALVGCGMGGVFAEMYQDAAFTLLPASPQEINDLLERLTILPLLKGARKQTAFNLPALKNCIGRVAHLLTTHPMIAELDINPLFVFEKGTTLDGQGGIVVDARLRCHSG